MGYSTSEKLIFIASFMWFLNWGVRLTTIVLANFL